MSFKKRQSDQEKKKEKKARRAFHHSLPLIQEVVRCKKEKMQKEKPKCASRESNAGPIDGNDGFYH